MKKRLLSAFLAVMMVLTMAPMAFAAEDDADTLQAKIDAIQSSGTIVLDKDYTAASGYTAAIGSDQNITIDLNGHTIENTAPKSMKKSPILNDGTLTITDSKKSGAIVSQHNAGIFVGDNSNTTIEYAKVESVEGAVLTGTATGATITIKDGVFHASDNFVVAGNGTKRDGNANVINISGGKFIGDIESSGYIACGIYAPWKDIITVNGGDFTVNNGIGIVARAGQVTVNGGTFACNGSAKGMVGDKKFDMEAAQAVYFDASNPVYPAYNSETDYIKLQGGTFSSNVSAYVAEGYVQNENGTVEPLSENNAVAKVGDTLYATFEAAVANAPGDSTVTLLKDATLSKLVEIKKNLNIDLNGKTLKREGSVLDIYNTVTIANGKIETTSQKDTGAVWVNRSANLTVEDNVTFITSDTTYAVAFDSSCTASSVTFKGTITGGNGITVNGLIKDTATSNKLIVDGANIKVKGHGLYLAGLANTEFTVNDSVISGATGIEIRAGKLNIANASISGSGALKCEPNGNGPTTDGAGIAIAQHTTKLPIDVTISDGEISGTYAIYESNPQNNDANSIEKIKLAVTGGKFRGALYSENIKSFITGGLFSDDPSDYCGLNAEGKQLTGVKNDDDTYIFTVGVAGANAAPVETATVPAKVDDQATDTTKTAADEMTEGADLTQNNVIEAAVKDTANKNEITAASNVEGSTQTVNDKLNTATNTTVTPDDVQIVYQTYVDVKVSEAEKNASSEYTKLSVDLTPMYRVIATTKAVYNSDADYVVDADGNDTGVNAIQVTEPQELSLPDKEYDIKLALPTGFALDNTALSIKHTKNSGAEFYKGITSTENGKLYVNFTTKGFSPFEITKPAASIPDTGMVYPTLADAVNAVEPDQDINLLQDIADNDVATVTKNIKFRVLNLSNKKFDKDKNIVAGSYTTKTVDSTVNGEGNATHTYTFTYSKPSSSGSSGSSGGSSANTFKVTTSAVNNGGVNASPSNAAKGKTITITLSPDKGYKLDKLTVTDGSGKSIATTKKSDTVYTFTMPASQVKVGVSYVKIDSEPAQTTGYSDVAANDWFADAVQYVTDKGMMNGTGKNTFGPQMTTTRGMIVTVLYRLEKEPSAAAASFTDVASGEYYANAVAWANANGIVSGYGNGKFGPNDTITREQLAAILYRYAQFKKYDVSVGEDTNILSYVDAQSVSSYAVPAIQWACGAGVVTGKTGGKLDPKGSATRAEVAAMLMRFCENVK